METEIELQIIKNDINGLKRKLDGIEQNLNFLIAELKEVLKKTVGQKI
jgi:tetrahydromethanopterin S-methyltransferase subunit G